MVDWLSLVIGAFIPTAALVYALWNGSINVNKNQEHRITSIEKDIEYIKPFMEWAKEGIFKDRTKGEKCAN